MESLYKNNIISVMQGGGHVVILGAGASIACAKHCRELNDELLPSMNNLIKVVGLEDIVDTLPENLVSSNFEKLYNDLHNDSKYETQLVEIENRVYNYFALLELPKIPTIYDYLLLSLRPRDLVATFNWDPFLYQAFNRNREIAPMPYVSFLHGNVSIGMLQTTNVDLPI